MVPTTRKASMHFSISRVRFTQCLLLATMYVAGVSAACAQQQPHSSGTVPASSTLVCSVAAPVITANRVLQRYEPMPFVVTVTVANTGVLPTDTVVARIVVPKDLTLLTHISVDSSAKQASPAVLLPSELGSVSWLLRHPVTNTARDYTVGVWVRNGRADSTYCEANIHIPPLEAPVLSLSATAPDSLHFDDALGVYVPNPFDVTLSCINAGGLPSSDVTAFIYLPGDVVLTDPLDSQRRAFPTVTTEWHAGDSIPQATWKVTFTKRRRYDSYLDFKFVVGGRGPTGLPMDSSVIWSRVRVPGLAPNFACDISMPDSLLLDALQTGLVPDPFVLRYWIWNSSKQTGEVKRVELKIQSADGLVVDPATPALRNVSRQLVPGDTLRVEWRVHAETRIRWRNAHIFVVSTDDEGNPVYGNPPCAGTLAIAPLSSPLVCDATASDSIIRYDPLQQDYVPRTWHITAAVTNTGDEPLTNLTVRISLADSSFAALQQFDPASPDSANPRSAAVLFGKETKRFTWYFRLVHPNMSGAPQTLRYAFRYSADGMPVVADGCEMSIAIDPFTESRLECELRMPDSIRCVNGVYEPARFPVAVRVWNTGTGTAFNVKAVLLQGRTFRTVGPAAREYGDLAPGQEIGFDDSTVNAPFDVVVLSQDSGVSDKVQLAVMNDGARTIVCEHGLFVPKRTIVHVRQLAEPEAVTLNAWPDPGSGIIHVSASGLTTREVAITVSDLLGREVYRASFDAEGGRVATTIDLRALPAGAYLLRIGAVARVVRIQ
ncbi:MAG: T9SS type A sorting domain-containing protein [Ignavibacteria bacterium]|nr:T9SS type A sorting domain-containing protein [Ignavibacteria bacterium]